MWICLRIDSTRENIYFCGNDNINNKNNDMSFSKRIKHKKVQKKYMFK